MAIGGAGVTTRAQSAGSRPGPGSREAPEAFVPSKRAVAAPAARGPSPGEGAMSRALSTFADLELASDDPFESEPAWFSDDDEVLDEDDDDLLDEDDEDECMPRALRTPQLRLPGFVSLAESCTPSVFTDALSGEICASPSEIGDSPILNGEAISAALPVAAMEAVDVDGHRHDLISLDQYQCGSLLKPNAIPITTTQIFGSRRKASKKPKDASAVSTDNSDAQSCASASSDVSTGTNASFATTISAGSCYGFVPYMPAMAFPPPIWRCRDCNIIHPADYKVCGKCCKKREDVGQDPVPASDPMASPEHQAAAAAVAMEAAAAMNWYTTQLAQAYSPQALYAAHAYAQTCGIGGMRPPHAFPRARSTQSRNLTRRGENVKDNPQMQKTAREGQKHWHEKVQQVSPEFSTAPAQR
jgi:hypothetical protein